MQNWALVSVIRRQTLYCTAETFPTRHVPTHLLADGTKLSTLLTMQIKNLVFLIVLILWISGCQRGDDHSETSGAEPSPVTVSSVPLRLWVVGLVDQPSLIQRQWRSGSEQAIDIRSLTVEEFLEQPRCQCDVAIFPSRLMGELISRDWIVKLPGAAQVKKTASELDSRVTPSGAWQSQAQYGGQVFAIPLGCSIPVFIASDPLVGALAEQPSWNEVLAALAIDESAPDPESITLDSSQIDPAALVDRFLAIAATFSQDNSKYGLLFEMQSMQSLLSEDPFVRAAEILASMGRQTGGELAVLGTHSQAWTWAADNPRPALAIASPALINQQAAKLTTGGFITPEMSLLDQPAADQAEPVSSAGELASGSSGAHAILGWNTGGGLVAALSGDCRQTSRAVLLLQWLSMPQTRDVLSPLVVGIEPSSPRGDMEALPVLARRHLSEALSSDSLPAEPRLPASPAYRAALAEELVELLSGKKTAKQAMADAAQSWSEITAAAGATQRGEYEKSLGLAF